MIQVQRRTAVLLGVLAGGGLAATTRAAWVRASTPDITGAVAQVPVTGADAAPAVLALALVAIAAAIVTAMGGKRLRLATAPLLAASGIGAIAAIVAVLTDPSAAAAGPVAEQTGVSGTDLRATVSAWPWIGMLAAALVIVDAMVILLAGRSWTTTAKYERAAERVEDPRTDPAAAWDALSRGEDPSGPPPGT